MLGVVTLERIGPGVWEGNRLRSSQYLYIHTALLCLKQSV